MKRKIKEIFKLLLAALSTIILVGLAGLWRLSLAPIKFDSQSPILRHVPESIKFSEIFLKSGKFYTIPELELRDVHFFTENIRIKSPKLFATWNLGNILKGDLRVSSVRFEAPEVFVSPSQASQEKEEESSVLADELKNGLDSIPVKYLELKQAKVFFDYTKKPAFISHADLYVLKLSKVANFYFSGFFEKGILHPFYFKIKGQLDYESQGLSGEVICKKIIPADLDVPISIKEYSQFYKVPIDIDTTFNYFPGTESFYFNGMIKFDSLEHSPIVFVKGEKKEKKQFALNINAPHLLIETLPKVWLPLGGEMRQWIFERIPSGVAHNINLSFVLQKQEKEDFTLGDIKGSLDVKDASIVYVKELPRVQGVAARVSFDKEKASVFVHKAHVRDLQIEDSQVYFSEFQAPVVHLDGKVGFKGPYATLIWYLNHDIFRQYLPGKMKAQSGHVKGQVHLSLPLKTQLKEEEIIFDVETTLKNGNFSFKYGDQNLIVKETNLTLQKNQERLKVEGGGNIGGFKSSFLWEEDYQLGASVKSQKNLKGSGQFRGLIEILPPVWRTHIQTPKGGEVILSFTSTENKDGLTKIDLDLDLTKASVFLPVFNWGKPQGESAKLEIDLETQNNRIQRFKRLYFMSNGLKIQGHARFNDQGKISEIYFKPLVINGGQGEGRVFLKNGIWEAVIKVPFLNFNPVLNTLEFLSKEKKKKEGVSLNLDLKVGTLFFKPHHTYKNLEIVSKIREDELHFLKIKGFDKLDPFSIRYQPHQENMVLEVELPRLDTILEGLEITDQVKSKKVQIQASKPLSDLERPLKGKLFIDQLKILNAPVFAKLLSLISLEGLVRALSGTGLVFNDNYAKFEYKDKQIALRRARIMNSSIGITATGYVDFKKKIVDLEGVLVPANFLNQLLGKIPLIGTLLTGGKDQGLFSVSYTAKGALKTPEIKSNPLGVVAPNVIKSLFEDLTGVKKPKPTLVEGP